jgi:DNA-binding NtrC family response regulator
MKRILFIDDDREFSAAVCAVLRQAGFEVHHAFNGREGLALYPQHRFDLVVSDILMPDTDGVEVILAIRKMDARLPIIAMSGGGIVSAEIYSQIARACGGNAFLSKPFEVSRLIEQVTRAVFPCLPAGV